ncbi:MAG: hypothetical protein OXC07_10560 [Kistimonas sp.]|nr:hypothetical protein [Kistimonas sp.]
MHPPDAIGGNIKKMVSERQFPKENRDVPVSPAQRRVRVKHVLRCAAHVYQVFLEREDGEPPLFWEAGQYLELIVPGGRPCAYSIASAPGTQGGDLELHIQCHPGHSRAQSVIEHLQSHRSVDIILPKGECHLGQCPQTPLVLIAAETGFSQMKAMVEYSLLQGHSHPVHLYWGARRPEAFYMPGLPVFWASEKGLHYHPVVSEPDSLDEWSGRHGQLYQSVLEDQEQLMGAHFYICGSPDMVYATFDALLDAGFPAGSIHSDVFSYSPRPATETWSQSSAPEGEGQAK